MRLIGYLKALKENSFAIPIYSDGISFFYHIITNDFKILSFEEAEVPEDYLVKTYLSKTFEVNSIAALIFVGFKNYLLSNSADIIIDEVVFYLRDTTIENEYLNIKKEASELQEIIYNEIIKKGIEKINFPFNQAIVNDGFVKYSLEEYIENSIIKNDLFPENKETLFQLFCKYLSDNKLIFELLILNSEISKSFSSYLIERKQPESIVSFEMSIEEVLKLRSEERRSRLREFNYQFRRDINWEDYSEPAYKRLGIDVTSMPALDNNLSNTVIKFEDDSKDAKIKTVSDIVEKPSK